MFRLTPTNLNAAEFLSETRDADVTLPGVPTPLYNALPDALTYAFDDTLSGRTELEINLLEELLILFEANNGFELLREEILPDMLRELLSLAKYQNDINLHKDPYIWQTALKIWDQLVDDSLAPILTELGGITKEQLFTLLPQLTPQQLARLWKRLSKINLSLRDLMDKLPEVLSQDSHFNHRAEFIDATVRVESSHLTLNHLEQEAQYGIPTFYSKDSYIGYSLHERAKTHSQRLLKFFDDLLKKYEVAQLDSESLKDAFNTPFEEAAKRAILPDVANEALASAINTLKTAHRESASLDSTKINALKSGIDEHLAFILTRLTNQEELPPAESLIDELCYAHIAEELLNLLGPESICEVVNKDRHSLFLQYADAQSLEVPAQFRPTLRLKLCADPKLNAFYDIVSYLSKRPEHLRLIFQAMGCPDTMLTDRKRFVMAQEVLFFFEAATTNPSRVSVYQSLISRLGQQLFADTVDFDLASTLEQVDRTIALIDTENDFKTKLKEFISAMQLIYGKAREVSDEELEEMVYGSRFRKDSERTIASHFSAEKSIFKKPLPPSILHVFERDNLLFANSLWDIMRLLRVYLSQGITQMPHIPLKNLEKITSVGLRQAVYADSVLLHEGRVFTGADLWRHLLNSGEKRTVRDAEGQSVDIYHALELNYEGSECVFGFTDPFKTELVYFDSVRRSVTRALQVRKYDLADTLMSLGAIPLAYHGAHTPLTTPESLFGSRRSKCSAASAFHRHNPDFALEIDELIAGYLPHLKEAALAEGRIPKIEIDIFSDKDGRFEFEFVL